MVSRLNRLWIRLALFADQTGAPLFTRLVSNWSCGTIHPTAPNGGHDDPAMTQTVAISSGPMHTVRLILPSAST